MHHSHSRLWLIVLLLLLSGCQEAGTPLQRAGTRQDVKLLLSLERPNDLVVELFNQSTRPLMVVPPDWHYAVSFRLYDERGRELSQDLALAVTLPKVTSGILQSLTPGARVIRTIDLKLLLQHYQEGQHVHYLAACYSVSEFTKSCLGSVRADLLADELWSGPVDIQSLK